MPDHCGPDILAEVNWGTHWCLAFAPLYCPFYPPLGNTFPVTTRDSIEPLAWQREGLTFNSLGPALRRKHGGRVQRISIDAGFTCPNVDGSVAKGGCNFCDNRSFSPSRRNRLQRVQEQMSLGITLLRRRYPDVKAFIAYFQPATNTYAPVDQLEELFELALAADEQVVGLAVGTRPDCVPESVLALLERLAQQHNVALELGMQSIHDESLRWMNRAHTHADLINAIDRSRGRGFETCVHVILGLPRETHEMMMQTADEVASLGFDSVKIHNLYAVHGTPLGSEVLEGTVKMMERDEYVQTLVDFLERLPPEMIVERISGDAPPAELIEPRWCLDKSGLRNLIAKQFSKRGTVQGSRYRAPKIAPENRVRPADLTPLSILERIEARGRLPVLKIHDQQ